MKLKNLHGTKYSKSVDKQATVKIDNVTVDTSNKIMLKVQVINRTCLKWAANITTNLTYAHVALVLYNNADIAVGVLYLDIARFGGKRRLFGVQGIYGNIAILRPNIKSLTQWPTDRYGLNKRRIQRLNKLKKFVKKLGSRL